MRLPVQLVDGFDDAQLNFENIQNVLTTPGVQALSFPQLPSSERRVYVEGAFTSPGSMANWAGGTNFTPALAYTHGQPTPKGAVYLATYINLNTVGAFAYVSSQTVTGCSINGCAPIAQPAAGTTWGVYVLAILAY